MTNTGKALIITGLVLLLLVVLSFPMCGAVYCLCSQASTPPPRQHVSDEELNSLICNGPLVSKGSKLYSHCQNVKRQRSRLEGDPGYKARRDGNAKLPQREKERWINFYVKNLHKISGGSIVFERRGNEIYAKQGRITSANCAFVRSAIFSADPYIHARLHGLGVNNVRCDGYHDILSR